MSWPSHSNTSQLNARYLSANGSSGMTSSVLPSIWITLRSTMQVRLSSSNLAAVIIASQCSPHWCSPSDVMTYARHAAPSILALSAMPVP